MSMSAFASATEFFCGDLEGLDGFTNDCNGGRPGEAFPPCEPNLPFWHGVGKRHSLQVLTLVFSRGCTTW